MAEGRAAGGRAAPRWRVIAVATLLSLLAALTAVVTASGSPAAPVEAFGPNDHEPVVVASSCTVAGPATESGSMLISRPMVPQITGSILAVPVPVSAVATAAINPGAVVATTITAQIDLDAIAQDVLVNRVRPGVVAAGYPGLAPSAWVVLDVTSMELTVPFAPGTSGVGAPVASASTTTSSARFSAQGAALTLGRLVADTRSPAPVTTATMSWSVLDGGAPAPRTITIDPGPMSFTANVEVGLLFYGSPVTGAVAAPWACTPDDPSAALASTTVVSEPVSTEPTTVPPSTTSTVPTSSSSSSTSTTWPSTTTTPPAACAVSGFDKYGGYTGIALEATGYFRTARIGGRWWLVDPDGHPFFSQGINNVRFEGTPDRFGATPYYDAVVAKYGTAERWADAQLQRMRDWGYNTLGGWSQNELFAGRTAYTVLLNQTSQSSATGEMEDLFDSGWEARARASAASAAAASRDDPYLLGYWSDNELHFGPDWRPLHLFDSYLNRPAPAAGKQALISFLQARYPTFAAFAADFTTTATDWASLSDPSSVTAWTSTGGEQTRAAWVGAVAERYFSVTSRAVRDADPNHLFLGPRFISQTTGRPVLEAAARYVDVASFNLYEIRPELIAPLRNADPTYLPVDGGLAAQAAILNKPVLISEWSYRASDSGLPNTWPPLFPTLQTQEQRAAAYERYVSQLLQTSWVVGQHWFEHADEPPAGRFDGEDSNFGLVNNNDDPYTLITDISARMNDCAYARLANTSPSTTTTTAGPPSTTGGTGSTATVPGSGTAAGSAPIVGVVPTFTG